MLQKLLQIAGVSTKEEFYKKYPTEDAFFKAHPEAKQLLSKKSQQSPMMAPPQAMYGMGMAYGGHFLPHAKYGMQPQGEPEPVNSDYPDYGSFKAAHDNWLANQQEQANNPAPPDIQQAPVQQQQSQSSDTYPVYDASGGIGSYVDANGYPVSVNPNAASAQAGQPASAPASSFKLNDYQGGSIYDFLTAQGKAGDLKTRKKLAQSLGMSNYRGTSSQNADMMEMIRQNPDILNSYDDATAPQSSVTRTAAQTQNKKAVPTTAQLSNSKSVAATGKPNVNWDNVPLRPAFTVVAKRKYQTRPGVTVHSKTRSALDRAINPNHGNDMIRRNIQTQQWEPVLVGSGPTMENLQRMKMAKDKNAADPSSAAGFPQFKQSNRMGGEPCYNCGGMYDQGGMSPDGRAIVNRAPYEGRALVNNYGHGGYYGNVPQHGNPGVYSDGTSGTFNGGQSFAGGGFFQDASDAMRTGSLQGLAGSLLPIANMASDKMFGDKSVITSDITKLDANGQPIKNSNLKDELSKYLSSATGDIKKEDLQAIVSKFDMGGMAAQGYVPEYGSQAYGGFSYGGVPLPEYNMGSSYQDGGYYPEGGEVSPEDQAGMDMQQAQQEQQGVPQEGGAPEQGQVDPQQIIQAVGQMIQQGMQPEEIAQKLVEMGIPEDQAMQVIQAVMEQMQGGGQEQGPQEEMMEGPQGQEAPMQEGMEGQAPPMGMYGGRFDYGGFNTTMDTTQPPYGVSNLSKFVGSSMAEPSLEAMHAAAMQNPLSRTGGYGDQVAQQYAQAASEAAAVQANHRMQRQMELEQMNRNQPYYNINPNSGGIRKYPPMQMPQRQRQHAEGGSVGEEMDVTPEQMEYLRKQGYKFDII